MSYEVEYNTATDTRRASLDAVQWLGFRAALSVARYCRYHRYYSYHWTVPKELRISLMMGGLQGYPVTALWKRWAIGLKR
jgi:hypothetical protein